MIYIVNPDLTVAHPVHGKLTYGGEWHFYYGDGTYGPYPTKEASEEAGLLGDLNTPATDDPATGDEPTQDPTDAPTQDPTDAPTQNPTDAPSEETTDAPTEDSTVPAPGEDATSAVDGESTSDNATDDTAGGAIQTGAVSLAVVLFAVLAAVAGGVIVVRRRYE